MPLPPTRTSTDPQQSILTQNRIGRDPGSSSSSTTTKNSCSLQYTCKAPLHKTFKLLQQRKSNFRIGCRRRTSSACSNNICGSTLTALGGSLFTQVRKETWSHLHTSLTESQWKTACHMEAGNRLGSSSKSTSTTMQKTRNKNITPSFVMIQALMSGT